MNDILLESVRVRKECESRIDNLGQELEILNQRKEELIKFSKSEDICESLKHALEVFKKSWSTRKKQLIQVMVPRLVMDEKRDELRFFINPLLDKSIKYKDLEDSDFEPMMTLRVDRPAGQKNDTTDLATENKDEKGCHNEEKSSFSGRVAGWTGLEPAASGVTGRRYNQLNYHPLFPEL